MSHIKSFLRTAIFIILNRNFGRVFLTRWTVVSILGNNNMRSARGTKEWRVSWRGCRNLYSISCYRWPICSTTAAGVFVTIYTNPSEEKIYRINDVFNKNFGLWLRQTNQCISQTYVLMIILFIWIMIVLINSYM